MSALKWATAAKLVIQIASWAATLIIVRLLTPEDYGLMAKVAVVSAIAGAIAELGLEAAIVRAVDIARDDLRKIFGVSLALGAGMTMAVAAAAPLFAHLFQEPQLLWPVAAAPVPIVIGAIAVVPKALATRELSFRRLSSIEMAAGVLGIAATLILALLGAGVWALVLGHLRCDRTQRIAAHARRARAAAVLVVSAAPEVQTHRGRQPGEPLHRRQSDVIIAHSFRPPKSGNTRSLCSSRRCRWRRSWGRSTRSRCRQSRDSRTTCLACASPCSRPSAC
jgi:hypothetical protein